MGRVWKCARPARCRGATNHPETRRFHAERRPEEEFSTAVEEPVEYFKKGLETA
jgi:hypothetical protein